MGKTKETNFLRLIALLRHYVINSAADNLPYEQIGKNEPVCIADEVPFEIPDCWEWVRLKCIAIINPRNELSDDIDVAFIPMPLLMDGYRNEHSFETKKWKEVKGGFTHFAENDIIVAKITPCFQNRKSAILHNLPNGFGAGTTELHVVRKVSNSINNEYLLWIFKSAYFIDNGVKAFSGTAGQQRVGKPYMDSLLIPLPPLEEQKRIVEKIQEVMPFCSDYEKAHETLDQLNTSFPDQLKKSILQWAVQGKLVPQDPNDEPASVLLEQIRAEKEQLIKVGKIKRDKHESVIFRRDNSHYEKRGSEEVCIDKEIPFEIPESWSWSRLSSFGIFSSGKTPTMSNPEYWNGSIPWVSSKDMKRAIIQDSEMHITELAAQSMQIYPRGTLLLVARSGILRRLLPLCVLGVDSTINQDIKAFRLYDLELSEWLYYAIKAFEPYILKELVKSVTTVESLKFDEFMSFLIPVPPLGEQKRIVESIRRSIDHLIPLSNNPLFSL